MSDEYISLSTAADMLSVNKRRMMPWLRRNSHNVKWYKQSKRTVRVRLEDVERFIVNLTLFKMNERRRIWNE